MGNNDPNLDANLRKLIEVQIGVIKSFDDVIDQLAELLAEIISRSGQPINLPGGYTFAWWPSKEYRLTGPNDLYLSEDTKSTECLLKLADSISAGWLDDLANWVKENTVRMQEAETATKNFAANH